MSEQQSVPMPGAGKVSKAVAVRNAFFLPYTPHGQGCVETAGVGRVRLAVRGNGHVV